MLAHFAQALRGVRARESCGSVVMWDTRGRLGGRVFVVGGSEEIPGAVILAAEAALRAGAGKLLVATAETVAADVAIAMGATLDLLGGSVFVLD